MALASALPCGERPRGLDAQRPRDRIAARVRIRGHLLAIIASPSDLPWALWTPPRQAADSHGSVQALPQVCSGKAFPCNPTPYPLLELQDGDLQARAARRSVFQAPRQLSRLSTPTHAAPAPAKAIAADLCDEDCWDTLPPSRRSRTATLSDPESPAVPHHDTILRSASLALQVRRPFAYSLNNSELVGSDPPAGPRPVPSCDCDVAPATGLLPGPVSGIVCDDPGPRASLPQTLVQETERTSLSAGSDPHLWRMASTAASHLPGHAPASPRRSTCIVCHRHQHRRVPSSSRPGRPSAGLWVLAIVLVAVSLLIPGVVGYGFQQGSAGSGMVYYWDEMVNASTPTVSWRRAREGWSVVLSTCGVVHSARRVCTHLDVTCSQRQLANKSRSSHGS